MIEFIKVRHGTNMKKLRYFEGHFDKSNSLDFYEKIDRKEYFSEMILTPSKCTITRFQFDLILNTLSESDEDFYEDDFDWYEYRIEKGMFITLKKYPNLQVIRKPDEWYYVKFNRRVKIGEGYIPEELFYKCDQFDAVLKIIKDKIIPIINDYK